MAEPIDPSEIPFSPRVRGLLTLAAYSAMALGIAFDDDPYIPVPPPVQASAPVHAFASDDDFVPLYTYADDAALVPLPDLALVRIGAFTDDGNFTPPYTYADDAGVVVLPDLPERVVRAILADDQFQPIPASVLDDGAGLVALRVLVPPVATVFADEDDFVPPWLAADYSITVVLPDLPAVPVMAFREADGFPLVTVSPVADDEPGLVPPRPAPVMLVRAFASDSEFVPPYMYGDDAATVVLPDLPTRVGTAFTADDVVPQLAGSPALDDDPGYVPRGPAHSRMALVQAMLDSVELVPVPSPVDTTGTRIGTFTQILPLVTIAPCVASATFSLVTPPVTIALSLHPNSEAPS